MEPSNAENFIEIGHGIDLGGKISQQDVIIVRPNFTIVEEKIVHLFAVFDGHGTYGDKASKIASQLVCEEVEAQKNGLLSSPLETLKSIFSAVQKKIVDDLSWDHHISGTTATVALLIDNHLYVANIGDSRLIVLYGDGNLQASIISIDHTCENEAEKQRVLAKGARLEQLWIDGKFEGPLRLFKGSLPYPGLAITRAFGDSSATKVGVTSEPSVSSTELTDAHKYIILASDGLWDGVNVEEVAKLCSKFDNAKECAEQLMKEAKIGHDSRHIHDNICEIVIPLKGGALK